MYQTLPISNATEPRLGFRSYYLGTMVFSSTCIAEYVSAKCIVYIKELIKLIILTVNLIVVKSLEIIHMTVPNILFEFELIDNSDI